ncbi:MAG: hypothetical protein R3A11_00905 [Bdellovibrionota bacterium]
MSWFSSLFGKKTSSMDVHEFPPKEEYVDQLEFERKIQSGFAERSAAIEWLENDPLRYCDYCDSRNRPSPGSNREGIQLFTFYKRVPSGAKDLRIVLGSYWYTIPAKEMKCSSCGKTVLR